MAATTRFTIPVDSGSRPDWLAAPPLGGMQANVSNVATRATLVSTVRKNGSPYAEPETSTG
jgi:hypothetical protein